MTHSNPIDDISESELALAIKAHDLSFQNGSLIKKADLCGCFHCMQLIKPEEIKEWVPNETTAICPRCGVDSIIPNTKEIPLDRLLLQHMRIYWFDK